MTDLVIKELKEIEKGITEEKEEKMLAKTEKWKFTDRVGILKTYDPSIN